MVMPKTYVGLRVDDGLLKLVDELAEKEGRTRTAVMEDALERGLEEEAVYVRALEAPLRGAIIRGLVKSGFVDTIIKGIGAEVDEKRKELALSGLKNLGTEKRRSRRVRSE
jgi:predicted transcriptional regulator